MSAESFVSFLNAVRADGAMLARYSRRDLVQLVFHAKNEGFDFDAQDITTVVGGLEINIVLTKDHEDVDGDSSLWREMWGRPYLEYVVDHVLARHSDDEVRALIGAEAA